MYNYRHLDDVLCKEFAESLKGKTARELLSAFFSDATGSVMSKGTIDRWPALEGQGLFSWEVDDLTGKEIEFEMLEWIYSSVPPERV